MRTIFAGILVMLYLNGLGQFVPNETAEFFYVDETPATSEFIQQV